MSIDEPRSLKERINDGRTAEFHAALFKILGDSVGDRRGCAKGVGLDDGTDGQKGLDICTERREFRKDFKIYMRIRYGSKDFEAVPYDGRV